MSKHTIHIGAMHLVIDVEQSSQHNWRASMSYEGERIEARADTEQDAVSGLLTALKSEMSGTRK